MKIERKRDQSKQNALLLRIRSWQNEEVTGVFFFDIWGGGCLGLNPSSCLISTLFMPHKHTFKEYCWPLDQNPCWLCILNSKAFCFDLSNEWALSQFSLSLSFYLLRFKRFVLIDLAEKEKIMVFKVSKVPTTPFDGQKPGTSGLRKKVFCFLIIFHLL